MRVVVTGGAGYLGSLLCAELLRRRHEVLALDSLLYGRVGLRGLVPRRRLRTMVADVRDQAACMRAVRWSDAVVHLAAIVGDPAGKIDPAMTVETNLNSTESLALLCKENSRKLVFASTCSVYGASRGGLLTEHDGTERPVSLYGKTKLDAERAIEAIDPPKYAILRMGTLFGDSPRKRFDLVANRFIARALTGQFLSVHGGSQSRPFLHVRDAAEAYADAVDIGWEGTFNIASVNTRIDDLAMEISSLVAPPVPVVVQRGGVDRRDYRVSSSKARMAGFSASRSFADAVAEFRDPANIPALKRHEDPEFSNALSLGMRTGRLTATRPIHGASEATA